MNKNVALALATLGVAAFCSAQEVGIGMSLKQGENTVYVPIRMSNGLMVEAFLTYNHEHTTNTNHSQTAPDYVNSTSVKSLLPGVGIFWLKPITDNSHTYLGARLGYSNSKYSITAGDQTFHTSNHGYQVTPTFGFEYFPVKHISIGGEVGYRYGKTSGSSDNSYGTNVTSSSADGTSDGTVTSLMVRFYF